jgi:ribosomal protein S27AE
MFNEKCPKCGEYSVKYDSYFKRLRCFLRKCGWISKDFRLKEKNELSFPKI